MCGEMGYCIAEDKVDMRPSGSRLLTLLPGRPRAPSSPEAPGGPCLVKSSHSISSQLKTAPQMPPSTIPSSSHHSRSWGQRYHRKPSRCPGYPTLPSSTPLHTCTLQPFALHSPAPQHHQHFPSPLGCHQYPREERQWESLGIVGIEMGLEDSECHG